MHAIANRSGIVLDYELVEFPETADNPFVIGVTAHENCFLQVCLARTHKPLRMFDTKYQLFAGIEKEVVVPYPSFEEIPAAAEGGIYLLPQLHVLNEVQLHEVRWDAYYLALFGPNVLGDMRVME